MPGQGTVGGPHVVSINGFNNTPVGAGPTTNPLGGLLFEECQVEVDLPKQSGTHDFVVP